MTPQIKRKGKPAIGKSGTHRKEMLKKASISSVVLPKIKIQPSEEELRDRQKAAKGFDEELPLRGEAGVVVPEDQVVANLTRGLGKPPSGPVAEVQLSEEELQRIARLRQRVTAAKERKRLANQKDIPNRDVFTLPTDLIRRLEQWSKGWGYQDRKIDLPISNCAAYLLYDTLDRQDIRERARDSLTPRDHKRWNHSLIHPDDKKPSNGKVTAEKRIIFQLNNDLLRKTEEWAGGFGNHIIVSQSQAVAFLLHEGLDIWQSKSKPSTHLKSTSNNYWKVGLFHPQDPRGRGRG